MNYSINDHIIKNSFNLGAEKSFTIMHLSDIHLNFADDRDSDEIQMLSKKRIGVYPFGYDALCQASSVAKENNAYIISTGDLTDFISHKNLEIVGEFTSNNPGLYIPGNHDFRILGGMKYDIPEIRQQSLPNIQKYYPNDLRFSVKIINGIKFIGIDNVYYWFEQWQLERLKSEIAEGVPCVLCFHVPLFEKSLYLKTSRNLTRHASLVATPTDMMGFYKPERVVQQTADDITLEMVDFIINEPLIKLIITGHSHFNHECLINNRIPQLTTDLQSIRLIEIK